jgi:dUTP pyrophosphatase
MYKQYISIPIKKLSDKATIPSQGSTEAAGYDLYAAENAVVYSLSRALIKTNISIAIPEGYYGRIAPRSGLAYKNGIDVLAGVIDSDYRGDIGVILFNTSTTNEFQVKAGDRIAQIIIEKCHNVHWDLEESLDQTNREQKGFGSTGV